MRGTQYTANDCQVNKQAYGHLADVHLDKTTSS